MQPRINGFYGGLPKSQVFPFMRNDTIGRMNNMKQGKTMLRRFASVFAYACAAWLLVLLAGCGTTVPVFAPPVQVEDPYAQTPMFDPAQAPQMPQSADTQPEKAAFRAVLSGDGAARGELLAAFNRESGLLHWKLRFGGLDSPVSSAGFYAREADGREQNVLSAGSKLISPHEGRAVLTPAQSEGLLAGRWRFRLNTRNQPQGALAGAVLEAR